MSARLAWTYNSLGHKRKSLEAIQETIELTEILAEMQPHRPFWKALKLFLEGDAAVASREMKADFRKLMTDELDIYFGPMITALACEIELAYGDYEEVLRITERAAGKMREANIPVFRPDLLYFQGCARLALGQADKGLQLFDAA